MSVSLRRAPFALAVGAALALSACSTGPGPSQVTRFHLGQPIAPGDFTVEPASGGYAADSLEFQAYAGPVAAELTRLGFRDVGHVAASELVATVDIQHRMRQGPPSQSGLSIGIGGASFGRHTGLGGGGSVGIPIGKARANEILGTQLAVQLKRRSDGSVIWEGRAMNEARGGTPAADPGAVAARLAHAMFAGFPGESGRTVTVK